MRFSSLLMASVVCWSSSLFGGEIGDWVFVPEYQLPERGANQPGNRIPFPQERFSTVQMETSPVLLHGMRPTQRLQGLLPLERIPREHFAIEMWVCHHVNQPVGAVVTAKGISPGSDIPWTLSFYNWESCFTMQAKSGGLIQLKSRMQKWGGFKERWVHLVAMYDGHHLELFVNGEQVATGHLDHEEIDWPDQIEFEMASYMEHEPYMQYANLVHRVRAYDETLPASEIATKFAELKQLVADGKLYDGPFHYTAGPYLNFATPNSMNLLWETDRPSNAVLEWGTTRALGEKRVIDQAQRLHAETIEGLQPNSAYFYKVTSNSSDGESMDSGLLTFKTGVERRTPFRFAVLGDTEARPHINDRLAKLIWDERPHFVVNLGDLTDGGMAGHRYEWTHEYFVSMTQLVSRIPMFAVPGNGEGDLVWYNHYHHYPEPENCYTFQYGDVAFFMLDSNRRTEEFRPGGKQYQWLAEQLKNCDSKWKIACHHHATYTGEEDDYGNTWEEASTYGDPAVRQIVPLYEKHGIDLVMFGHLHLYERSYPIKDGHVNFAEGTVHLLAGGGGGNLEDFAPSPAFFSAKTHRGHHYLMIEVSDDDLTMCMHDTSGAIRDRLQLTKNGDGRIRARRVSDEVTR